MAGVQVITLRVPAELHAAAKDAAYHRRRSLNLWIRGLVEAALEVDAGGGLLAGPCAEGCAGPARFPHDSCTGP